MAERQHDVPAFDWQEAFSRNVGWVTREEQQSLRAKKVAIAGMGGVGGIYLQTLARLGVGSFRIADFDRFELANMNRQAGATMSSLGREKVEVMRELALDINPELDIQVYPSGVTPENVDEFLGGTDCLLDSVDFFALDARRMIFETAARNGIPAITAAPLGMGVSVLSFLPGHMTFEEYFRFEGQSRQEQLLRFIVGLAPAHLHATYLVDPGSVDLARHKGPSTPMAASLCAGVAVTQVLKVLIGRGKVRPAPHGMHFDAFRNRLAHTWRPGGNHNPLQRLMLYFARRQFAGAMKEEARHLAAGQPADEPADDPAAGGQPANTGSAGERSVGRKS